MAAPKGNKYWLARSSHGLKPKYATTEDLLDACYQYFQWVDENPIEEAKLVSFQGMSTIEYVPKQRVPLKSAMLRFIGLTDNGWDYYKEKSEDFLRACMDIEQCIKDQKFDGASAGIYNPMIIARDLGLRESTAVDHTSSDRSMTPQITAITPAEVAQEYQDIISGE